MKTRTTRILALLLALTLLSLTACTGQPPEEIVDPAPSGALEPDVREPAPDPPRGEVISTSMLASSLREQFADSETVDRAESLWNVPQDQTFYVELGFDIREDTDFEGLTDVFAVYADPELTESVGMTFEIITHERDPSVPAGHNRLIISPFQAPPGRVWGTFTDATTRQDVTLDESGTFYLHETGEGETWGFLRHFYLALHVDTQTAEPLERPLVTIFTLENSLDAPLSEFFVTEDGYGGFRWDRVEGADYYLIVRMDADATANSVMWPIAQVDGTKWIHPENPRDASVSMNQLFRGSGATEDDLRNPYLTDEMREMRFENFTVIAVNSETHSAMGTIHRGDDIAARLPVTMAHRAIRQEAEEAGTGAQTIPSIGLLPTQRAITMANGVTVHRRIVYDFDSAQVREDQYTHFAEDGSGEIIGSEQMTNLHIPFVVEGTVFTGTMTVENIDPDTYREQLETVRAQLDDTAPRGGGTTSTGIADRPQPDEEAPSAQEVPAEILDKREDRIFANSALSAFLAHNLLAANEFIDLSEFPESADFELLIDAFFEAMYQNPLILHVAGAGTIPGSNVLVVEYKEPIDTILAQQDAIRQIVPEIVAEIITDDMSDLEKSVAINQFLVETAEYDWDALDNAEQNDFQSVDAAFNDSFTAYGILINRVGVCAGYAAAFTLLADEAGLDSIVVTGYLEGFLPHAWNRVYIDGQWHTLDVTNNANEFLFNVFLHLPDDVAGSVLIEDSAFLLDDVLGSHTSDSVSSEYFHITNRFFDRQDISLALARELEENGSVTLRTDFDLDDDTFIDIVIEVMILLDTVDLHGFHWLGVIFMLDGR